jgi:hypothetical protein
MILNIDFHELDVSLRAKFSYANFYPTANLFINRYISLLYCLIAPFRNNSLRTDQSSKIEVKFRISGAKMNPSFPIASSI